MLNPAPERSLRVTASETNPSPNPTAPAPGASPAAARAPGEPDAPGGGDQTPEKIRSMFERVSPTYDRLNFLLSGAMDRRWRARMARELTAGLEVRRALDVAAGTGDLTRAVRRRVEQSGRAGAPAALFIGADFTRPMLARAAEKYGWEGYRWVEADGLRLPFADGSFDVCSIGFGLRNMADRRVALAEMARVVRPGGRVGILEFSQPSNPIFRTLYDWYSFKIMPRVGYWLSGSTAYLYLPESIRKFIAPKELAALMEEVGLANARWIPMALGSVVIHLGEKKD